MFNSNNGHFHQSDIFILKITAALKSKSTQGSFKIIKIYHSIV